MPRRIFALLDLPTCRERMRVADGNEKMSAKCTRRQGQYLAYIHSYTLVHGLPPAERDLQCFFHVSPPAVHQMVLTLEKRGLISRIPNTPRSIRVLLPREELPALEPVPQPASTDVGLRPEALQYLRSLVKEVNRPIERNRSARER